MLKPTGKPRFKGFRFTNSFCPKLRFSFVFICTSGFQQNEVCMKIKSIFCFEVVFWATKPDIFSILFWWLGLQLRTNLYKFSKCFSSFWKARFEPNCGLSEPLQDSRVLSADMNITFLFWKYRFLIGLMWYLISWNTVLSLFYELEAKLMQS